MSIKDKYALEVYRVMKGMSPVIATVLLLLMAVAAVGGAWVWYQRMQVSAQLGGEGGISTIKATTSLQSVYVDRVYSTNGNYTLYLGNQGADTIQINSIQIKTTSDSAFVNCNSTYTTSNTLDIASTSFGTVVCYTYPGIGSGTYTSGENVQVKLYASGASVTRIASTE